MGRASVAWLALSLLLVFVGCGGGTTHEPPVLTLTPSAGPPGTVLTVAGAPLSPEQIDGLEVWVGHVRTPVLANEDGTLRTAVPLFLGPTNWTEPPREPQVVEVRRSGQVLGRSSTGVTVMPLERAPGATQEAQMALVRIGSAYDELMAALPTRSEEEARARAAVFTLAKELVSDGEDSLQALLNGTAPTLAGSAVDVELIDAILASSGAAAYLREYAAAFEAASIQSAARRRSLAELCDGDGDDVQLACSMQIFTVLDDYNQAFVKPTVQTYANTVGIAMGLIATSGVTVPVHVLISATLSVAEVVYTKLVPALLPSRLTVFDLEMHATTITLGEVTTSRIIVAATNDPPPLNLNDVVELTLTVMGLKDLKGQVATSFQEVLSNVVKFTLELFARIFPSTVPDVEVRIPPLHWGPVEIQDSRLVELFSIDSAIARPLEDDLEWQGVGFGETTVRVTPRGAGSKAKILRDRALCLFCIYYGGAFGNEVPSAQKRLIVGDIVLTATPWSGRAPFTTTFAWTGLEAQEEPVACILDVGDAATLYTIADCATTTSQQHTYPFTSVLESASGLYRATLHVVGSDRVAAVEVLADWTFTAAPAQGRPPLDVTFSWSGFDPAGGPRSCLLDPGDGSPKKTIGDCVTTKSATHRYAVEGRYVASLVVTGSLGHTTKTAPVNVTEDESCSGLMDVRAWRGTISYMHGRDVEDATTHIIYDVAVDVGATLTETHRSATAVDFFAGELDGVVTVTSEEHEHHPEFHRVIRTFFGSGTPVPYRASDNTGSRMSFNVFADCSYQFYTGGLVAGSGTFYGQPTQTVGSYLPLRARFADGSLNISGSHAFPLYTQDDIQHVSNPPTIWMMEGSGVATILGKGNLGTVTVTWSFTPMDEGSAGGHGR